MKKPCKNCGRPLPQGVRYCPECGQRSDTERLTWSFLCECVTANLLGDDAFGDKGNHYNRGILPTWWAVMRRPGRTAREYILQGRRRGYFNPVAIMLILGGLLAWIAYHTQYTVPPLFDYPRGSVPDGIYLCNRLYNRIFSSPANQLLVLLPLTAAASLTFFRRRGFSYVEMLYVQVFAVIAALSFWLAVRIGIGLFDLKSVSGLLLNAIQWIWLTAIFRRLIGIGCFKAALAGIGIQVLSFVYYLLALLLVTLLFYLLPLQREWTDLLLRLLA